MRIPYDVCAAGKGFAECRQKMPVVLREMKQLCILDEVYIVQIMGVRGFSWLVYSFQISGTSVGKTLDR